MSVEKQLVNNLTWINLDIEKIKNLEDLSKVYRMDKETIKLVNNLTWINLDIEKIKNLEDLSKVYRMDKETIKYALDRNGCAHMDYHRENGTVTFD